MDQSLQRVFPESSNSPGAVGATADQIPAGNHLAEYVRAEGSMRGQRTDVLSASLDLQADSVTPS